MIKISCEKEKIKDINRIIESGYKKIRYYNYKLSDWLELADDPDGIRINDIYGFPGNAYYWNDQLLMGDPESDYLDVYRKIKKKYPDVEIDGDITIGDNNYHMNYVIRSAAGAEDVTADIEFRLGKGIHDMAWYVYLYYPFMDYGQRYIYFISAAEAIATLEEMYDILKSDNSLERIKSIDEFKDNEEFDDYMINEGLDIYHYGADVFTGFFDDLIEKLNSDETSKRMLAKKTHKRAAEMIGFLTKLCDKNKEDKEIKRKEEDRREAISLDGMNVMFSIIGYCRRTRIKMDFNDPDVLNKAVEKISKRAQKGNLEAKFILGKIFYSELKDKKTAKKLIKEAADEGFDYAIGCIENNPEVFGKAK